MIPTEVAGWVGGILILAAYALVSFDRLAARSYANQALNIVGALGLGVNAWAHGARPNIALEFIWAAIGVATILSVARGTRG